LLLYTDRSTSFEQHQLTDALVVILWTC